MRFFGAIISAAIACAGAAQAKPLDVSFPIVVSDVTKAEPAFNVHAPPYDPKHVPANVVFRQDAQAAGAVRLNGGYNAATKAAGWITVPAGAVFILAKTSQGDVYCRAFMQMTRGKYQYNHAGICLRDSDRNGAFDQMLQAPEGGKLFSVFDIKQVDKASSISSLSYSALAPEARPHADIVLRARVTYGAGLLGAAAPPQTIRFSTAIATPDEFLTESWGARNWPFVQLDVNGSDHYAPETTAMVLNEPVPLAVGPFKITASPTQEIVSLQIEGSVPPGTYDLTGRTEIAYQGAADRRRLFFAKPLPAPKS